MATLSPRLWDKESIDTWHVLRTAAVQAGAALIHVAQSGNKQILVASGANTRLTAQDVAAAAPALTSTKTLLVQLKVPLEAVKAAVVLAADASAQVVLDPAPPTALPDELLRLVDVIKPNATEDGLMTVAQLHEPL